MSLRVNVHHCGLVRLFWPRSGTQPTIFCRLTTLSGMYTIALHINITSFNYYIDDVPYPFIWESAEGENLSSPVSGASEITVTPAACVLMTCWCISQLRQIENKSGKEKKLLVRICVLWYIVTNKFVVS